MLVGGLITAQVVDDDPPAATPAAADGTPDTGATSQPVVQTPADTNAGNDVQLSPIEDLPALIDSVIDSVVEISVGNGEGSGVVLDTDGHILTNFHVIESGGRIIARLPDGSAAVATVLGTDPSSDLAVLQADFDPSVLRPATLGNSDAVEVGDSVFAVGKPFSQDTTVTSGIVSATGRVTQSSFTDRRILNVIQTDAALNPGNSGGPLFNAAGEVIGINTSITGPDGFRGSVGLGFAVPSNIALRYLPQMLDGEDVQHTQLGVGGETIDEVLAADQDLAVTRGFWIGRADQISGAAAAAGVQVGDVITDIAGVPIESFEDLAVEIDSHEVGDDVVLTIIRGGSEIELTATLQAWVG
jgi:putative serine protease PepD